MGGDNGFAILEVPRAVRIFLRPCMIVIGIIEIGLIGYATSKFSGWDWTGLTIFTVILTWLICAYYIATVLFLPRFHNYFAVIGLDALAAIFWLSSMGVCASWASTYHAVEDLSDNYYGDGYYDHYIHGFKTAWDCVAAAAGIAAIELVLFVIALIFEILTLLRHNSSGTADGAAAPAALADPEVAKASNFQMTQQEATQQQQPGFQGAEPGVTYQQPAYPMSEPEAMYPQAAYQSSGPYGPQTQNY